jgi:hypothetical protein
MTDAELIANINSAFNTPTTAIRVSYRHLIKIAQRIASHIPGCDVGLLAQEYSGDEREHSFCERAVKVLKLIKRLAADGDAETIAIARTYVQMFSTQPEIPRESWTCKSPTYVYSTAADARVSQISDCIAVHVGSAIRQERKRIALRLCSAMIDALTE